MQLRSPDGATVDLSITGYQFPDYKVPAAEAAGTWLRAVTMASRLPGADARHLARDWDANWLLVRGDITLEDGKTWAFEDFSLEALPPWLRGTAEEPGLFEYFVRLEVSADELTRAAEWWLLDLAEFPPR